VRPRPGVGEAYGLPCPAWLIAILSTLLILTVSDNIRFRAFERFTGYSTETALAGRCRLIGPQFTKMRVGCSSAYREFGALP